MKVLDDKKADIVHMHGYGATTFGRICAAYRKIPAILHEHANHTTTPWFQQMADSALAAYTDLAIAVSKSTADFVINARKMPAEKTKVVYLGVPLEEFARPRSQDEIARARADLGVPEGALAIGTITRLMPFKGNTYLVQAFKSIFERVPNARGFIVGEGELSEALQAEAKALGISDRLTFSGFKRDVAGALSALDIVVFPSLIEGTPLTAFEALAMGKPIVSTDADGLKDILTGNRDALIVPRENPQLLADADRRAGERSGAARGALRRSADHGRALRHPGVRREDGTPLRAAPRGQRPSRPRGGAARGPQLPAMKRQAEANEASDANAAAEAEAAPEATREPSEAMPRGPPLETSGRDALWRGACRCRRIRASRPVC